MGVVSKIDENTEIWDGLCDEKGPIPCFPPVRYDTEGRMIKLSPAEEKVRSDAARRTLAVIRSQPDGDPPEIDVEFMRGIDENRPPGKKIFEDIGLY
jgi:hypothetical protein